MEWNESYNIGIDVIDNQHRQILDYINALEEIRSTGQRDRIKEILNDLIDYTQCHISALKKTCWNKSAINIYLRIAVYMNYL